MKVNEHAVKAITLLVTASTMLISSVGAVLADIPQESGFEGVNVGGAFQISSFGDVLNGSLNLVLFVALLVFAYMIWGGIQWITSGGDKGKTEEARNKITAAVLGLAVIAASYAIFKLVLYVLGISDPLDGNPPDTIRFYDNASGGSPNVIGPGGVVITR